MVHILVKVTQGSSNDMKIIQTAIENASMDGLLAALKESKETTNIFMTELVNQQKSSNNTRKIEDLVCSESDEDINNGSKKQKR